MNKCVWYISKYVATPSSSNFGGRGYFLMKEIARLGYTSIIITSDSNHLNEVPLLKKRYQYQKYGNFQIIWIKTIKYRGAKSFRRILSWLDFEIKLFLMRKKNLPKPDAIIISSLSLLTILNGLILRSLYHCRLIFEIRDIWPLTLIEEGGFKKNNPFIKFLSWIEKIGYKYTDIIVGTMPNLKEHVKNVLGYEKKVSCIPMGVDLSSIDNQLQISEKYINKYIPKNKFIVAYAGTVGITNALDTFFECAKIMQDKTDIHFLLVGKGDLLSSYQKNYSNLKNLTFAPKVPKQMVQSILTKCDLLYLSANNSKIWDYGQSLNKVIDYMVVGKPIIASYNGYPSMINEACCGTFIAAKNINALKDEIIRYYKMPKEELNQIGQRGREWILNNRNYSKLAQEYISIIFD